MERQNPTAKGDRVLWNAYEGASTESPTPSANRSQAIPSLIAIHIGERFIARCIEGGANG